MAQIFLLLSVAEGNITYSLDGYKKSLWTTYRDLPDELKSRVGRLSAENIEAMTEQDAERLYYKMWDLKNAHNDNVMALTSPVIQALSNNMDDSILYYKESTKALKQHD